MAGCVHREGQERKRGDPVNIFIFGVLTLMILVLVSMFLVSLSEYNEACKQLSSKRVCQRCGTFLGGDATAPEASGQPVEKEDV